MGGALSGTRVRALVRLERAHLRSEVCWLLWPFGVDLDRDRGFLERCYQLYMALLVGAVLVLMWGWAVSVVAGLAEVLGTAAGACARAALAAGLVLLAARWGVALLREPPLRLRAADVAWLARVARPEELLLVREVCPLLATAVAGGLAGWLAGVLAAAPGPVWIAAGAAACLAMRSVALAAGLARCVVRSSLRAPATAVAVAALVALATVAAAAVTMLPLMPLTCGAFACALVFLGAAAWCAPRLDMAFVIEGNAAWAARQDLLFLQGVNPGAAREAARRARASRSRQARRTWRFGVGWRAPLAHGHIVFVRRPSELLSLLSISAALVPAGALAMAAGRSFWMLLAWLVVVGESLRTDPPAHWRAFRADCRCRMVRQLLPFSRLELVALDGAAAFALGLAASLAVTVPAALLLSAPVLAAALLAALANVVLWLAAGFEDPGLRVEAHRVRLTGMSFSVLALLLAALCSLLGPAPAAAALVGATAVAMALLAAR